MPCGPPPIIRSFRRFLLRRLSSPMGKWSIILRENWRRIQIYIKIRFFLVENNLKTEIQLSGKGGSSRVSSFFLLFCMKGFNRVIKLSFIPFPLLQFILIFMFCGYFWMFHIWRFLVDLRIHPKRARILMGGKADHLWYFLRIFLHISSFFANFLFIFCLFPWRCRWMSPEPSATSMLYSGLMQKNYALASAAKPLGIINIVILVIFTSVNQTNTQKISHLKGKIVMSFLALSMRTDSLAS